jgi:ABC-type arginine transport system permease subunit
MKYKLERIKQSMPVERGPGHTGHFRSAYGEVPEGMGYREIGQALGMSHTNVMRLEKLALEKLKRGLIKALAAEGLTI